MRFIALMALLTATQVLEEKYGMKKSSTKTEDFFAGLCWFMLLLDVADVVSRFM